MFYRGEGTETVRIVKEIYVLWKMRWRKTEIEEQVSYLKCPFRDRFWKKLRTGRSGHRKRILREI